MNSEEYRRKLNQLKKDSDNTLKMFKEEREEISRVLGIMDNTKEILDDLDREFSRKTGLTGTDIAFLFTAVGLQILRQYLITKFPIRLDDQTASKNILKVAEHSNRIHRYYNPSLEEILCNPVPFDANIGANGALKGGGKFGHRGTTLGHDPILGLFFGTANIATATLTNTNFESWHIRTSGGRDCFAEKARTDLVITKTFEKLFNGGLEGKIIVASSLIKEIIHLKTDIHTKNSLPFPFMTTINPELAKEIAQYGIDMSNIVTVGRQAVYANLINMFIAMLHRLLFDGNEMDKKLYEVRTRKILSYSNAIATSSNIIFCTITEQFQYLDLGGLIVTLGRLISDTKYINKIKEEFIFGTYEDMVMNNPNKNYFI